MSAATDACAALCLVHRNRHAWKALYPGEQEVLAHIGATLEAELRPLKKD